MKGKEKFLSYNLKENEYAKQLSTNTIIKDKLELWYGIADKNGYYYDYPIFDDINDYELFIDNKLYSLPDYLKEQKYLDNYFAIISTKKNKILGIEQFAVNRCNSFYSIPLNPNCYELLNKLDLDELKLKTTLFNTNLIEYETATNKSKTGYEILMFIESDNKDVMTLLNQERIQFLSRVAYDITEAKRCGIYNLCIPRLITINYNKETKRDLELFLLNKQINKNNKVKITDKVELSYDDTLVLVRRIEKKQEAYQKYFYWYVNYINHIFLNLKSLNELDNKPNFLVYGYYDKEAEYEISE